MQDISEFNISFVKLVERHPCLYDSTVEDYYRGYVQDKAWETIAQIIGPDVTVKECKSRWRNLRGRFTKHLKSNASSDPAENNKRPYYLADHLSYLLPFTKPKKSHTENEGPYLEDSISRFLEMESCISDQNIEGDELEPNEEIEYKYAPTEVSETDKCERLDPAAENSNKRSQPVHSDSPQRCEKYRRLDAAQELQVGKSSLPPQNAIDYSDSDMLFLMSLLPDLKRMNDYQKRKYKIGILRMGGEILNEHPAIPLASSWQRTTRRNSSSSYMSPDSGVSRTHHGSHDRTLGNGESNENSTSN